MASTPSSSSIAPDAMNDAASIDTAVRWAFAAVNLVVWTGLFFYLLSLGRKIAGLEADLDRRDDT